MLQSHMIGTVQHAVISAKTSDWDSKFLEALTSIELDTSDKTVIAVTLSSKKLVYTFTHCLTSLP